MLHNVILPEKTRIYLSEAVSWQLQFLECALAVPDVTEAAIETWLAKSHKVSATEAGKIVDWLKPRRRTSTGRIADLKTFRDDIPASAVEKQKWLEACKKEAFALLRGETIYFEETRYDESAPAWRRAAAIFLERFYHDLDNGLPAILFTSVGGQAFTREIFLNSFFETNPDLCICPVCDMTPLRSVVRGSFYVDIDHFFPKSLYPHLSIHPYNLIPICHVCNSGAKKALDPLANPSGRSKISSIRLPYRSVNPLSTELQIRLPTTNQPFELRTFALRSGVTSEQSIDAINDVLQRVFDIPQRWDKGKGTIGEIMFRRVREHLWFLETEPTAEQSQVYLDELIAMVEQHSSAQEPYSIAILWWLVHLCNNDLSQSNSPFLGEIRSWQAERRDQLDALRKRGKELRTTSVQSTADS